MSETVRRCLGCQATYPPGDPACPKCGSHAGEVEQVKQAVAPEAKPKEVKQAVADSAKPKPTGRPRRRKT